MSRFVSRREGQTHCPGMRTFTTILSAPVLMLALMPLDVAAQDVGAPSTPAPELVTTDAPAPARTPDIGLYVGVGLGSNLNLGGGSFGYQLEASVGFFYRMLAVEILGGTTTINGDHINATGPHVGGAVRVHLFQAQNAALQLGAGVRYHDDRRESGEDDRYTGGFASLRLLLPVSTNINVRIDTELEHVFDGPMQGVANNRLMLGFGIETRVSP